MLRLSFRAVHNLVSEHVTTLICFAFNAIATFRRGDEQDIVILSSPCWAGQALS